MKIDTPEKRKLIDNAVASSPDVPSKTLARILWKKHGSLFPSLNAAYSAIRARRGTMGKTHRALQKVEWKHGKAGTVHLPPSLAARHTPASVNGNVLVLADVHLPYHDMEALEAALNYADDAEITSILLGGDFADFFSISRFMTSPDSRDLVTEMEAVDMALKHLRKRFPKARIVWKLGNHEERLSHYLWQKAPELYGMACVTIEAITNCEKHRVEIVDNRRSVKLGKLTFLHGHELEQGAASPVNPARGLFLRALDSYCMGHRHRTSEHVEKTANGRFITCWSIGCLCDLTPQYAVVNKWNHGFAVIEVGAGGTFRVHNKRIHHGKVL